VPVNEWADIFSILWQGQKEITSIFKQLVAVYQSINFSEVCYVQYSAVLRKHGTLLNVTRLNEILGTGKNLEGVNANDFQEQTTVLYLDGGAQKTVSLKKSELCALSYELVFKVNEELKTPKPFLKNMDILDFPGARARQTYQAINIIKNNIPMMLLRGKVAYLFNKYSDAFLISNLLLCHNNKNFEAPFVPGLLNKWICRFIGSTPKAREDFIKESLVPPLFIIGTMFNLDLQYNSTNDKDKDSLINRWTTRFNKVLENEVLKTNIDDGAWFNNWTETNKHFKNIFMLRDFLWSERGNVYSGYEMTKSETLVPVNGWTHGEFMTDLKQSFVNFQFVKEHFDDPNAYWDAAATPGNDGTALIIAKLTVAANNIKQSQTQKFKRDMDSIIESFFTELRKHFHDDAADERIKEKIEKAGRIQLNLETVFRKDHFFFGRLMQKFFLKEDFIYNYYRTEINNIKVVEKTDFSEYAILRLANPELKYSDPNMDRSALFNYNISILQKRYRLQDDALKKYFEDRGIDLEKLFSGELNILKSNSIILSEGLVKKWTTEVLNIDNFKDLIEQEFSEEALLDLIANMLILFNQLDITNQIAKNIRVYVDRYNQIDTVLEMIADISAEIINNFVSHMGFDHYSADKLDSLKEANENNELQLVFDHSFLNFHSMDIEELQKLFETLDRLPEIMNQFPPDLNALKNVPNFSHYFKWTDQVRIAFAATCDTPTYNVEDNKKLGLILDRLKEFNTQNK
jgi:hypothetical protein